MTKEYSDTIPVQYETGNVSFMGINIHVDPRVFIPRPETELLIRTADVFCQERSLKDPFVLEIGTGSGIIPVGLKRLIPLCRVVSVDISSEALEVARLNIKKFALMGDIELLESDMFEAVPFGYREKFDVVLSNPPYVSEKDYEKVDDWVRSEPRQALVAGKEGMDYLDILAQKSAAFLKPGGFLAVEIGYDQADKVKNLFDKNGFENIKGFFDFNNYERVITGWKHG